MTTTAPPPSRALPRISLRNFPLMLPSAILDFLSSGEAAAIDGLFDRVGSDTFTVKLPFQLLDGVKNIAVFRDPELVKPLLTAPATEIDPTQGNRLLDFIYGDRSMFLIDGPEHLRIRKVVLPRLRGNELAQWGPSLEQSMREDAEQWPSQSPVQVIPRMLDVSLESILDVSLGIGPDKLPAWKEPWHDLLGMLISVQSFVRLAGRRHGGISRWASLNTRIHACDKLIYDEIAYRRATPDIERTDLLDLMMNIEGEPLSDKQLRDQIVTIILAGHETTATTVSWALNYLVHNPEALATAVAEARDGSGADTYAEAIVHETLRMHPPAPVVGRVTLTDYDLGGYRLRPNTLILPAIENIHRRSSLYPDPHSFRPERFLDNAPGVYTLIPFGGGPHRCLGDRFAMFQAKLIIQTVLRTVNITPLTTAKPARRTMWPGRTIRISATTR